MAVSLRQQPLDFRGTSLERSNNKISPGEPAAFQFAGDPFTFGNAAAVAFSLPQKPRASRKPSSPRKSPERPSTTISSEKYDGEMSAAATIAIAPTANKGGRPRLKRKQSRFLKHLEERRSRMKLLDGVNARHMWLKAGARARHVSKVLKASLTPRLAESVQDDAELIAAADAFELRHRHRSAIAESACFGADVATRRALNAETQQAQSAFARDLAEVRRNRFIQPYQPPDEKPIAHKPRPPAIGPKKAAFDLYRSIWRPRIFWADSHDLYDTEEVRLTRFANDWSRALEMGLVRMILRNDDEGDDWVDKDGDGIPDEVEEVGEAIWLHNQLLYATFSHYASLNGSLDAITLNSWNAFVHDCGLPLKGRRYRKESDFDLIFLEADACGKIVSRGGTIALFRNSDTHNRGARGHRAAAPAAQGNVREFGHNASMLDDPSPADLDWRASAHVTAQLQPQVLPRQQRLVMEKEHQLSRSEFLIALVRIAINIFVLPNIVPDVSDAMDRLLGVVVQSRLGALVTSEPDTFRRAYCYSEPTCTVLKRNEKRLHRCFSCLVRLGVPAHVSGQETKTLSLKQWLHSLRALQIIEVDLPQRDALRCFSWARTAVGDFQTTRGHFEDTHLPFEGFLEALCRLAAQKALPTEDEMRRATKWGGDERATADVGAYLAQMRQLDPVRHAGLLAERALPWMEGTPTLGFDARVQGIVDIFHQAVVDYEEGGGGKAQKFGVR